MTGQHFRTPHAHSQKRLRTSRSTFLSVTALRVTNTATSAVAGLLIARILGPTVRGEYSAATSWFGAALILGELGQPAAIVYFVAHHPARAQDYVATSRNIMAATGLIAALTGWFVAPAISNGYPALTFGYRLLFVACPFVYFGATYSFALQARSIVSWSLTRTLQPVIYLGCVTVLTLMHSLSLPSALISLLATILLQTLASVIACKRYQLLHGRHSRDLQPPLLHYGATQLLATTPTTLNVYLDQLVLSQATQPSILGQYSLAVSLSSLAYPLVTPIGNILFPQIASGKSGTPSSYRLQKRAITGTIAISAGVLLVVTVLSPWLVPLLFGAAYRPAVQLLWILAPSGVLLTTNQVIGDILRGRNKPSTVALGQGVGAILTIPLLALLVPSMGAMGAAIATVAAYGATATILMRATLKPMRMNAGSLENHPAKSQDKLRAD